MPIILAFYDGETDQVSSGVHVRDKFPASLLGVLDSCHGPGVGTHSQFGGEGTQTHIVAGLFLLKASHSFCPQVCHKERTYEGTVYMFLEFCVISFVWERGFEAT